VISTPRLDLIPATLDSARSALEGGRALSASLRVSVPSTWPPDLLDSPALEYMLARMVEDPARAHWWLHFAVLRGRRAEDGILVGTAGYKGPPLADGTVEIGYSIVSDHQRRGYASEAALGLVAHAFTFPEISAVIAQTLPDLVPSIGVLLKCGFRYSGQGSEPGAIQYRLDRPRS
jgi:RimJ/RimL family protein N-acetyltransferase